VAGSVLFVQKELFVKTLKRLHLKSVDKATIALKGLKMNLHVRKDFSTTEQACTLRTNVNHVHRERFVIQQGYRVSVVNAQQDIGVVVGLKLLA